MGYRLGPGKDPAPCLRKACGCLQGEASCLSKVRVSFLSPLGLHQEWPPSLSPHCPLSSGEISCSRRRPGRFLLGKEGAGDLGGADTPHQSQWLITGVRAQPHVHRFPGDPRDKGDIHDSTKPSGGIWQQRSASLSPFRPCSFSGGWLS